MTLRATVELRCNNQFSCMVFLDISKAFDRVWDAGLLHKLEQHGISGDLFRWISSYLLNRTQSVVLNSFTSAAKSTSAGVPQGSVLGPPLFLIYVNDISENLLSLTRLFADDSSLFFSASKIRDIEGILTHDLMILTQWARKWMVNFNQKKQRLCFSDIFRTRNILFYCLIMLLFITQTSPYVLYPKFHLFI